MIADTPTTTEPPRIIFLIRNLLVGGAERVFVHYVNELSQSQPVPLLIEPEGDLLRLLRPDLPVLTLSSAIPITRPVTRPSRTAAEDDRFDPKRQVWIGKSMLWILKEAQQLADIARTTDSSAVTSFLMRPHIIALLAKLLFNRRLRVILNVHEMMSATASYLYTNAFERSLMRMVTRHLFPFADHIVAVSKGVKFDLVDKFGLPADKISVVHNPIDIEAICQSAPAGLTTPAPKTRPIIAAVGRLVHLKGFDLLLDAVASMAPKRRPRILFIGEGPERAALADQALRLGIGDLIDWLGGRRNPWQHMRKADMLVIPSRTEAFPNVIGEAFALGLPVLAAECSEGMREYLMDDRNDKECGLLVPPDNVSALANGIDRMLTDANLREELAKRGRQRVENFSLATVVSRYDQFLTDILKPAYG